MAAAPLTASMSPLSLSFPPHALGQSSTLIVDGGKEQDAMQFDAVRRSQQAEQQADTMARNAQRKTVLHCSFAGCQRTFAKACKLQDHERSHTGERPFVCEIDGCQKDFKRKDHLQRHQRSHLSNNTQGGVEADEESIKQARPFQCNVLVPASNTSAASTCDRRFLTRQHLARHVREYHDQSTSCDEGVSKKSDGEDRLTKPKRNRHKRPATYVCELEQCNEAFTKRKLLRAHVSIAHSDRNRVPDNRLDQAEIERVARLPFPCTYGHCDKRFATNSKRMAHIEQKHRDTGRYVCMHDHSNDGTSGGVAQFATWSALQAHQRSAHRPTCPIVQCGKQFKEARTLRQHLQRIHGCDQDGQKHVDTIDVDGSMEFSGDTDYEKVQAQQRSPDGTLKCPSPSCSRQFGTARSLRRHGFKSGHIVSHTTADADEADVSENETECEAETDDDFFRREGGAVPEEAADRGKTHKRRWDEGGVDGHVQNFTLNSLTGHSYNRPVRIAEGSASKKRRMRGRVLGCPWQQISRLRDEDRGTADFSPTMCQFRFSRLYDVQRHLRGVHKVNLTQTDIQALLFEEERKLLGTPRPGTQIVKEAQLSSTDVD